VQTSTEFMTKNVLPALFLFFVCANSLAHSGEKMVVDGPGDSLVKLNDDKVYLHFDRPLYEPGDDIWFNAYLRDGSTLKPSQNSNVLFVELIGPNGKTISERQLFVTKGRAAGDFELADNCPGGTYTVRAYTKWMKNYGPEFYFSKELIVQKAMYPKLLMDLEFEKKAYGPSDEVIAFLDLKDLENSDVYWQPFRWTASLGGKAAQSGSMETDDYGKAVIRFKLPADLTTSDGLLNVMVDVDDYTESISRKIPIVLDTVRLHFFPEGGDLVQDVASRVGFMALDEFGKLADVAGIVVDNNGKELCKFSSYHNGMGAFPLLCKKNHTYFVKLTKPFASTTLIPLPEAKAQGHQLAVNPFSSAGLEVSVWRPKSEPVALICRVRDEVVYKKILDPLEGWSKITIPTTGFPIGIAQITLFDAQGVPQCERLVFVNKHRKLNIAVTPSKEKYQPREEVELRVKVTDEKGLPVMTQLSMAVADDKVISFADDEQDNIFSALLLNGDLQGSVENPSFYFDREEEKADTALDFVMMTHGWRRFSWQQMTDGSAQDTLLAFTYSPERLGIKGIVALDSEENRLANTKVVLRRNADSVYTDKQGHFFFETQLNDYEIIEVESVKGFKRYVRIDNYTEDYVLEKRTYGKIVDAAGDLPVKNAYVFFSGTEIGCRTDSAGFFELKMIPESNPVLVVKHERFRTKLIRDLVPGEYNIKIQRENWADNSLAEKAGGKSDEKEFKDLKNDDYIVPQNYAYAMMADAMHKKTDMITEIAHELIYRYFPATEHVSHVDEYPAFPGGDSVLNRFICQNLVYPERALDGCTEGTVHVYFSVSPEGKIYNPTVQSSSSYILDDEALRIVGLLPDWSPATLDGQPVQYYASAAIRFSLDKDNAANPLKVFISEIPNENAGRTFYKAREFYWPLYNQQQQYTNRTDFRKTIYWNPAVKTKKDGTATIRFFAADEVTAYRITTNVITENGDIGANESVFYTQLPFSIDARIPRYLSYGDEPKIPVTLTNNTDKEIKGTLGIYSTSFYDSYSYRNSDQYVTLGPKSKKTIEFPFEVRSENAANDFTVYFRSEYYEDRITQPITVAPNGFPMEWSYSGSDPNDSIMVNITNPIFGTIESRFWAHPHILSQLMGGVESILREPHGCFEQVSSSTYPNILALQLMKETGIVNREISKKAQGMIERGYNILSGYETPENGFDWYGTGPAHTALSAYGLMEFRDMQEVWPYVDEAMIERTEKLIMSRANGANGFERSTRYTFGGTSNLVWNSYILYALTESGVTNVLTELNASYEEALKTKDVYCLALLANAMYNLSDPQKGDKLMALIEDDITSKGMGHLSATSSITSSTGQSLQVETAALILMANFKKAKPNTKMTATVGAYLVQCRSGYGGFGSTQATILALKAITAWFRASNEEPSEGYVDLYVNANDAWGEWYDQNSVAALTTTEFADTLNAGEQKLAVEFSDPLKSIPWSMSISWYTNEPASSQNCNVALNTSLESSEILQGETVRMTIQLSNTTGTDQPSTMAVVGIPGGLGVQMWQLQELRDRKEIDYFELKDNLVYLYYTRLEPDERKEVHLDLKAEIKGRYLAPASSAYLYYTNEDKNWHPGETVVVL